MNLLSGIAIELSTIILSSVINYKSKINVILEPPKRGYKLDKDKPESININESKKQKITRLLTVIAFFIPVINIIESIYSSIVTRSIYFNILSKEGHLIPMTSEEKEQFSKIKKKKNKLKYYTSIVEKNEQHIIGYLKEKKDFLNEGIVYISQEKLPTLDYTLEEVKQLNEATNKSYRIGRFLTLGGEIDTAIIGFRYPKGEIKKLKFATEKYKIWHPFHSITEEEAKGKKFIVYQHDVSEKILTDEKIEKVIKKIKKDRNNKNKFFFRGENNNNGYINTKGPKKRILK